MSNESEFYMVIETEFAEKSFEIAAGIAKKFAELTKSQDDYELITKKGEYHYEFVMHPIIYSLKLEFKSTESNKSLIRLSSFTTLSEQKDTQNFYDLCFDLSKNIDPLYSIGGDGIDVSDYGPAWVSIEHYKNPYFFCLEPPKSNGYNEHFIENEDLIRKAVEIEKVLPRDELLNLIQAHCKKVAIGPKGGVSVLKSYGYTKDNIALRFYLAKEVRKRGIQLEEGDAEQFAKKIFKK